MGWRHGRGLLSLGIVLSLWACSPPGADPGTASPGARQGPAAAAPEPSSRPEVLSAPDPMPGAVPGGGPAFVDVTAQAGIRHRHERGRFDEKLANIMPWISSIGAAAAVSDYDRDGDLDLYVTTSRAGRANALYRNEGGLRFTEVGEASGVAHVNDAGGASMDAAFADLDNDGDDDLYVAMWGRNRLFRNEGDGTFRDVTESSGTGDRGNANCVLPFDHDGDGLLDLLICNYFPPVDLQDLEDTAIMHDSFEAARNGGANVLLRNLGGLRFEDVAHALQLDDTGWSLDAGISDADNDGDADLYIANDFGQDRFFLNEGGGRFTDFTMEAIGRETFKGMNVDFGDFNGDGFTDIYVANITTAEYLKEGNFLWLNGGDRTFTNVAAATGTHDGGWGWCGRFFDYDLDGDLDILTVNGFVSAGRETYWDLLANAAVDPSFRPEDARQWPPMGHRSLSGHEPARLFRNRGDGAFEEVAQAEGIADRRDGRGIALADFDGDGDLDVYLANQDAPGALYRNDGGGGRSWIAFELVGTRSNRNAIGARVELRARPAEAERPLHLVREVNGVNGYASQSAYRIHFGLGSAPRADRAVIFWPSGVVQEFRDLEARRLYRITEEGEPLEDAARRDRYFARLRHTDRAGGEPALASPPRILELESLLRRKPRNAALGNEYRRECVEGGYFDRSIAFFRALLEEMGDHGAVRLQLALAYIDKIPAEKGDVLAQGSTAKESLSELAVVEERRPRSYAVHFITGMNHLYWPAALKHADDAVRHFEVSLELERERREAGRPLENYHAEIHLALGDAHVKGKDFPRAREAWATGRELFPEDARFVARLAAGELELQELVKVERGLEERIDTQLAVLLEENGLREKEAALRSEPADRGLHNEYRLEACELDALDRAKAFLRELSAAHPAVAEIALQRALLFADRMNGGRLPGEPEEAFSTRMDRLAEELRRGLDAYSAAAREDWIGPYLVAVIELYLASDKGSAALEAGPRLEDAVGRARREDGRLAVPYPAVALGDVRALAGDAAGARAAWEGARALFPRDPLLRERHGRADAALEGFLASHYDAARGLPVDLRLLADREAELARFEEALEREPARALGDRYRRAAVEAGDVERAVAFFEGLVARWPRSAGLRVQLALALLDRTPDRSLGSVRKGLLSSRALEVLEPVFAKYPARWGLHYLKGLIHLNWFTKLQHVPLAVESFDRCLKLQRAAGAEPSPHHALAYQAMGDACVKQNQFARGRMKFWKVGSELFPNDRGLKERLDLTAHMVNAYVEERRSWDWPQDTGLLSELIGDLPELPEERTLSGGN